MWFDTFCDIIGGETKKLDDANGNNVTEVP